MISKFFDLAEQYMEIFMDDFSIFGSSHYLTNVEKVLKRYNEKN